MKQYAAHAMHVPGAAEIRDRIAATLAAEGVCLHLDEHRRGLMPTWVDAVRHAVDDDAAWTLILSDDADPLPNWRDHLIDALRYSPAPLLALTHFGAIGRKAAEAGYAYTVGTNLLWGGAVALRQDVVQALPAFIDQVLALAPDYPHDDGLMCLWASRAGVQTACTSRAIFDQVDTPSLIGHHGKRDNRRPHLTIRDPGPWWSKPGHASRNLTLSGVDTKRLIEALG